ncbi:MAG: UDP-N-acetylmuramate dehydrogenase [Alphaproteobacteria bacterium]|nr:UDP-N-acetylmuramate dehydrogenase [Alphaproteobacteria bacterium]
MSEAASRALLERMPRLRGTVMTQVPLSRYTWFRVGGPADVLVLPKDEDDLKTLLEGLPADVPLTVIGVGSNLLVRDGGVAGVVLRLSPDFARIRPEGGTRLRVGAAALDAQVARAARDAGLTGLEFLAGIPGTIGGALRMNAGAYGRELKDALVEAVAYDRAGARHVFTPEGLGMRYRHTDAPEELIFVEALLEGRPGDRAAISARMDEITGARAATQPIKARTGGSTFKNPPAELSGGRKAWQLIDGAGCRGLAQGDAQVSEQHCNFLINRGNASAADLERLGETVRARVRARLGVELDWEIKRIGREAGESEKARD